MAANKRVLYIGSPFFDYYKYIIKEFEALGYEVDYFNDRPSENSLIKGIHKIRKSMTALLIEEYFNRIMRQTDEHDYDIVFIMNCKAFSYEMIKRLRDRQKAARFILYMWDSLTLYPDAEVLIPLFDQAYSFDSDDCEKNSRLTLLPLFYTKPYEQIGNEDADDIRYDISSVCTAHPNRYRIMKELFPALEARGMRIFSYMYINILQYMYNKLYVSEFKNAKMKEFKFKPLSVQENLDVLRKTDTVFDIQHNMQSGLTMRTIEAVGSKRKLITVNKNIVKYDFYNSNNIYLLDEQNMGGIEEFIRHQYEPIPEEIHQKYSIGSWLKSMIL